MSSGEEHKLQEVNVENFDFNNDVFRKTYGTDIMQDAEAHTQRMKASIRNKSKTDANGNRIMGSARLSKFEREIKYPGSWTEQTLDLLETWVAACKKSAEAHANAARAARKKYRMISIPTIIIGTAATALSFFSAGDVCDPDDDSGDNLRYGVAALTSLVTILSGINSLYNFSSKTQESISAAGSFSNLARRGELQIWLPNDRRGDAEVVLTDISAEYASLTTSSPLL